MKKTLLMLCVSLISMNVMSKTTESWCSIGAESGSFSEKSSSDGVTTTGKISSSGINFTAYSFSNESNIGYFVNDSFLFPKTMESTTNGVTTEADLDFYDSMIQIGIVIGPAFRNKLNDKLFLRGGLGFSYFTMIASSSTISFRSYNLGLGADIGLKYDLNKVFFIDGGAKLGYDFYNVNTVSNSYGSASNTASNYSLIRINPYVSIGFTFRK